MDYLYTIFDRVMDKLIQVSNSAARTGLCFWLVAPDGAKNQSGVYIWRPAFGVITYSPSLWGSCSQWSGVCGG